MKKLLVLFILLACALPAYAEQQDALTERRTVYSDGRLAEMYFYESSSELMPQEEEIIRQSLNYRENNPTRVKPFVRPDGSVVIIFGLGQQTIICAVLQITDIELQPGESVQDIHLGDTARWLVEPAITGSGPYAIQHLIIKPFDVGLDTTLVLTTNLRTYHFRLKSQRRDYMPRVSFAYPDAVQEKWRAIQQTQHSQRQAQTIPETGEYLGNLDFGYVVQGTASWKPVRVYNDGMKTIIQMPAIMQQLEAPTLLIIRHEGGLFSDEELVLVNYRVQSNRYIVDSVFDKAVMIIGVGDNQDRVTIIKSQEGGNL